MSSRTTAARRRIQLGAALGALCVALTGCGTAPAAQPEQIMARADLGMQAPASTFTEFPTAPKDPAPEGETDGVVLRVKKDIAVHHAPGGPVFAKLPATQLENPTWVPIIAERGAWAQVLLPSRPNGSTGWIRTDGPVERARTPYAVDVDIDARRMVVRKDGAPIGEWVVGVGAPASPTPRGRTYVMAAIEETVTKFSPIILPLGTHSNTFSTYGGGPGTVALHGWPEPSVFGQASSDGCVRVPDDALQLLTTLPLGTLVHLR
ncbi:L,D-transpeptidase catalytic domain [Saccharopolyspora antimicrobica]|uniref:L,D-transpeptidase catalytic domain n=1 Tax=Saccharopolyspora antimicrobica TaxID=455193 RepID=A0A1I4WVA9_9PSEU|nr:L,D-transpeptidase [Saccharopolyspora antimicrobica]RKT84174.1 L,D-transpeptidase-like protein [Saccharopolyspora antimicrobica]SFN17744.1 L,D-transpeptidase catalytic domain [Saccharopolyspora antimicrobica]